jgi:hypothetical protein
VSNNEIKTPVNGKLDGTKIQKKVKPIKQALITDEEIRELLLETVFNQIIKMNWLRENII